MANPTTYAIGTGYGVPGDWAAGYHPGVDFLTPIGTTLRAPVRSKIIFAGRGGWGDAYGIHVIGEGKGTDGKTYRWVAAHMSNENATVGDVVEQGEAIGLSGATGRVTGPHCHFEVRESPFGYWEHVNPKVILGVRAAAAYTVGRENVEYVVEVDELNGRSGPGTSYPVKKTASLGAKITSVGITKIGDTTWVKNVEGLWWARRYLNVRQYPVVADDTVFVVTADPSLAGRTYPVGGDIKVRPLKGAKVTAAARTKAAQDDGAIWVKNIAGHWFSAKYLEATTEPPAPVEKMHLRIGHYNLPGPDKHANADARAKRAALLVETNKLDVLTTNELVGTSVDSTTSAGSAFARTLHGHLGTTEWGMVVPTTAYNENYIFYRKAKVALKRRFADKKIYAAGVPGRHVTRVMLTDRETGKDFAVGDTHLVNNNEPGALAQAPLVWDAMAEVKGTAPVFINGDMNTEQLLPGLINEGLVNARRAAKSTTNPKASTYVGWADTTPDYDPNWIIDHLYVDPTFQVDGYTVVLDTKADGTFNTPKPSDHLLVIIAVTEK